MDLRRMHRDGSLIDVNVSAGPIRDAHGNVTGIVSTMIDVSARKRSERMLTATEGRKDAILRASLDAVVVVDEAGVIVEANPATEETIGWTRHEPVGKPFLELVVAPADREGLAQVFRADSPLLGQRVEIT